jgi:hypothetical protein
MSGIDLLLRTAIDYERTHQLALFTLLSKSSLSSYLVGIIKSNSILWEPEGKLFDLKLQDESKAKYLEIKMWSSLYDNQKKRQYDFLNEKNCICYYVLLGTSWFEHSANSIADSSGGAASKIGYDELINALNQLMIATGQSPDVYELALAYRNAIQEQFDKLRNAFTTGDRGKLYFYSLYWEIQKRLKGMETAIYTVNNRGGSVYILNSSDYRKPFSLGDLSGELLYELENGQLRIKFYSESSTTDKHTIRDRVRQAIKSVLGTKFKIINKGRTGAYMTACEIDHDFCDIAKLDKSAEIFQDVANEFNNIINAITS